MSRLNIRIPSWLKEIAVNNSSGNISKYVKSLIIKDNSSKRTIKKISCIKTIHDTRQDRWLKEKKKL